MDIFSQEYLKMKKPTEKKIIAKKRSKKDERYLRRMSKSLEIKNTVHSNKRIQQRFYSCSEGIKKDILDHLDNCWINRAEEKYLIIWEYGKYILGMNGRIVTVLKHHFLLWHFEKMNWRPKFTNITQEKTLQKTKPREK
jgi:hypothetical protein